MVLLVALASTPTLALAESKSLLIAFDRNKLCCIMNHMNLERMLTDIEGINKASFFERKREITIEYDDSVITIPQIVDHLIKITMVDRDVILLPENK